MSDEPEKKTPKRQKEPTRTQVVSVPSLEKPSLGLPIAIETPSVEHLSPGSAREVVARLRKTCTNPGAGLEDIRRAIKAEKITDVTILFMLLSEREAMRVLERGRKFKQEQVEHGRKGGSRAKRKAWAEAIAKKLRADYPKATNEEHWKALPEWPEEGFVQAGDERWEYNRDGDKLHITNDRNNDMYEMAKSTFIRWYL